jgi:hypothetical protein
MPTTPSTTPVARTQAPAKTASSPEIGQTDRQIMEELLRRYRFPDAFANVSVAVYLEVERVLPGEQRADNLVSPLQFRSKYIYCYAIQCRLQILTRQQWMEPRLEFKHIRGSSNPIRLRSRTLFLISYSH